MDYLYLIIFALVVLGIIDLVVGVTNDAVNFLISAIGSKVAKRKYIYMIAAAGIIIGSMFSGGMMEVARKGIFNPEFFYLDQLLIIFVAVMFTDIILIDLFNTFGYPTSTTVAIVFELLGGALALGLIIIGGENPDALKISDLINTHSAVTILAGIVLSIVVAFFSGAIIQFFSRLVFTFRYKNRFKLLFSLAGALAISAISFLILKKDIAFANIISGSFSEFVQMNLALVLFFVFALAFITFITLSYFFKIDIPRVVVFAGTFTIALSFASNDLINFIGIPLSGIEGVRSFMESGESSSSSFLMNIWNQGVLHNSGIYNLVYLFSAVIMIITLFTSRKLRSVTETEMHLGRQDSGYESFEPSQLSRYVVHRFLSFHSKLINVLPAKFVNGISKRYERSEENVDDEAGMYFDTVRASVNLVVASFLVAIGTYFTIPLSTTFVVFMVVMGTSLADQAWGRESAVFRLSGVFSILGGWFITAIMAFIGAFVLAIFIWWAEMYAIVILLVIAAFVLYHTKKYHKKIYQQQQELNIESDQQPNIDNIPVRELGSEKIRKHILETSKIYMLLIQGFVDENIKQLKETCDKIDFLGKVARNTKEELFANFSNLGTKSFDAGHYFVQALDYLGELSNTLRQIATPVYNHIENQHKGLSNSQKEDALILLEEMTSFFNFLVHIEKESKFDSVPEMVDKQKYIVDLIEDLRKKQIKRILEGGSRKRSSILLLECYAESKNLVLYTINLLKSHRDFYNYSR
ncbi:inorganic phosphate transporter [Plebeiibacterium sediminum]|uniref:Phosphate transporter n=1 Tax=Plebeiibacterium sediminum TaxID=2992112 RepID=A0AAE3M141_9BACT|nr:inorganic phosphate transporter [Plebeiobacterium sediminum]MCW3784865.1 inorganic phosphate transporter [Plebeiobacterium sediminum]